MFFYYDEWVYFSIIIMYHTKSFGWCFRLWEILDGFHLFLFWSRITNLPSNFKVLLFPLLCYLNLLPHYDLDLWSGEFWLVFEILWSHDDGVWMCLWNMFNLGYFEVRNFFTKTRDFFTRTTAFIIMLILILCSIYHKSHYLVQQFKEKTTGQC